MRTIRIFIFVAAAAFLAGCTICKNNDHKGSIYVAPPGPAGSTAS